jgi:hypothetical protein
MSDEIRAEDEVEAHGPIVGESPGLEGPGLESPGMEATEDDDVEAHGPVFAEGGLAENAKNAKVVAE